MSVLSRSVIAMMAVLVAACGTVEPVALMNRADPLPDITTSGQPDEAALEGLSEDGYVAVIDLRGAGEDRGFDERGAVEGLGMSYVSLPISGGGDLTYEQVSELDRILADIDGPVLLHCASSNRVGALLAMRAKQHGASNEAALQLGQEAGMTSLRPVVEQMLNEADSN